MWGEEVGAAECQELFPELSSTILSPPCMPPPWVGSFHTPLFLPHWGWWQEQMGLLCCPGPVLCTWVSCVGLPGHPCSSPHSSPSLPSIWCALWMSGFPALLTGGTPLTSPVQDSGSGLAFALLLTKMDIYPCLCALDIDCPSSSSLGFCFGGEKKVWMGMRGECGVGPGILVSYLSFIGC